MHRQVQLLYNNIVQNVQIFRSVSSNITIKLCINLVLQESADNVSPDSTSPSKDALLEEACKKYDEATHLCPTLHDVCKKTFLYFYYSRCCCEKFDGRFKKNEKRDKLWKARILILPEMNLFRLRVLLPSFFSRWIKISFPLVHFSHQ